MGLKLNYHFPLLSQTTSVCPNLCPLLTSIGLRIVPQKTWLQFSSVAQSCLPLCDPMNCSTSGLPVYHQLPKSTQTHVHWVGDAILPSYPLSFPSPPAFNLSQHQGLCIRWPSMAYSLIIQSVLFIFMYIVSFIFWVIILITFSLSTTVLSC